MNRISLKKLIEMNHLYKHFQFVINDMYISDVDSINIINHYCPYLVLRDSQYLSQVSIKFDNIKNFHIINKNNGDIYYITNIWRVLDE